MGAVAMARARSAHRHFGHRVKIVQPIVAAAALRCSVRHVRNLVRDGYLTRYEDKSGHLMVDLHEICDATPRGRLDKRRLFPHHQS